MQISFVTRGKTAGDVPIAVIGVRELPRGAVVEVEALGAMRSTLACGVLFKDYERTTTTVAQSPTCPSSQTESPLECMRSMPLWTTAYNYPAPLPPIPDSLCVVNESNPFTTRVQYSCCDTVMCWGFVGIAQSQQEPLGSVADYEQGICHRDDMHELIDIDDVACELCSAIHDIARSTCMQKTDLRVLKVYYNVDDIDGVGISSAISVALAKICGIYHIVPHIIPVCSLRYQKELIVANFCFLNYIQMKTEQWIRNR